MLRWLLRLFSVAATALALAAMAYWFAQAMGYSAMVGLRQPAQVAGRELLECRANAAFSSAVALMAAAVMAPLLRRRWAEHAPWPAAVRWAALEQCAVLLVAWLVAGPLGWLDSRNALVVAAAECLCPVPPLLR